MPTEVGKPILAGQGMMEIPNLGKRRMIRSAKNPMDKCTVVSIFPKAIDEVKFTIEPGHFSIEPGTFENPAILVVGSSSWWKDIDFEQPLLEIPTGSIAVAESIVNDYCNGMLGCDMVTAMPGLFFVMGTATVADIKTKYTEKLEEVKNKQDNWYRNLVAMADSLWARTNGNPLTIASDMRLAARSLNLNDKPWLKDFQMAKLTPCVACGSMRDVAYPICPSCRAIDKTHPLASELKFAV
jgi:hypothetical protein